MAKRQSTANVYRGRNRDLSLRVTRAATSGQLPRLQNDSKNAPAGSRKLAEVLRNEHGRLADALSVLTCVYTALLHSEEDEIADQVACAKAVAIVLSLVREAAHQLDAAWVTRRAEDLSAPPLRRRPIPARR